MADMNGSITCPFCNERWICNPALIDVPILCDCGARWMVILGSDSYAIRASLIALLRTELTVEEIDRIEFTFGELRRSSLEQNGGVRICAMVSVRHLQEDEDSLQLSPLHILTFRRVGSQSNGGEYGER